MKEPGVIPESVDLSIAESDDSLESDSSELQETDDTVEDLDGWIRSWGQSRITTTHGLDIDSLGNLYVAGAFERRADFDPGEGVTELVSTGEADVFISKFNPDGELLWTRTWGNRSTERIMGLAVDSSGNSYTVGTFSGVVDFNPAEGDDEVREIQSVTRSDVYLNSLDADGNLRWVRTWGDRLGEVDVLAVAVRGNSLLVTGWFSGTVDFDPSEDNDDDGVAGATAGSASDAFVSRFTSGGNFQWTATWGGEPNGQDQITGTSITTDAGGNIYVAGRFQGRFEISAITGLEMNFGWQSSSGREDAFLCKLNPRGYAQWAKTWGGASNDYAMAVAMSGSGNIYVTGGIEGTADLNPAGYIEDEHIVETRGYIFLSKFSPSGGYQWGRTWGDGLGIGLVTDPGGNILVTGTTRGYIDFDPDPAGDAVDEKAGSVFFSKFDSGGDYLWSNAWGRTDRDFGAAVTVDSSGNIYGSGMYRGTLIYDQDIGFIYTPASSDAGAFLVKFLPDGGW